MHAESTPAHDNQQSGGTDDVKPRRGYFGARYIKLGGIRLERQLLINKWWAAGAGNRRRSVKSTPNSRIRRE